MTSSAFEELVSSLPVKGRDTIHPVRTYSPEELDYITRDKKEKRTSRRSWSGPAEDIMKRILKGPFGARNVVKQPDRLQSIPGSDGRFWSNAGKPDLSFATIRHGDLKNGVMEVKSTQPSATGLVVTLDNIKWSQVKEMNRDEDRICLWGLVFWQGIGIARAFVVEHHHFMQIIEALKGRASGKYKGYSLRFKHDMDLLQGCEVLKSNHWYLPEDHWWFRE